MPSRAAGPGYSEVTKTILINGDQLSEYKLENGMRVLVVPRHQAKVLTYQIWFRVGSVQEKLDPKLKKTGLAHLFEHMMFRGTEKYPDGKFDELSARLGTDRQNATTYYYRTNYYESIPSRQLESLMELESDRMSSLRLTKDLFEKEKGAVVGEYRRHMDSPPSVAIEEVIRQAYGEAEYRYTVLGTEEEIKGFSLEEAQYFYKTFYSPNNATLIVIGDTTEQILMPLVVKYYGPMKPQQIPSVPLTAEPRQAKERRIQMTHPQASSDVLVVAYHIPSVNAPEAVALSLLSTHLSVGMESRLRKVLVDKGIAVNASASASAQPDLFKFFVSLAEGKSAESALRIIDREVESLRTMQIPRAAFDRALNQELLTLYGDISDNSELGNWLGEYLMLSDNYLRGFEIIEGYKKITPKDIQKAVKESFRKENRSVVILRPQKQGAS